MRDTTLPASGTGGVDPGTQAIRVRGIVKEYNLSSGAFTALAGVDLDIEAGEFVAIVGRSGSGKTTLLNLLAGIDRPTSGEISVAGTAVHALREAELAAWRGRTVGLVFQFFQLLPTLTVAENVMIPMDFCRTFPAGERRGRALALLERMGIAEQADKLPSALSGGQQQRAAIARALANDPPILLADEPTGNLDSQTGDAMLQLFTDLTAEGRTIVMVTHERDVSRYISREITLADGRVAGAGASAAGVTA
ncbi:ABC transporter ATP-binding protein [Streptomyces lunaelactis]|uniref:ABC transporter ATP-binding protein n=1 Tax=Streptomyces lunaelactis TaxID=1535768 RepID=A0A2R4SW11_9ACTN|nr:ABC transporter ATP-binding protein [Streptomyces lunaelactis]AVZ71073.1 ABC transporter ATP-binding protein [Streptomyces lunaelactis]NUK09483.1 ABC transporter ATP-binding protein [Streptomyces lunaelactis]NUK22655.1 ABC transporter ATP-binding protein [Streptomyces lunaelactis]NUK73360.1 ABC transporter ATP-binding protein [Streptomyces lunaelactis]NUL10933.1 ABC transporter ATP-binding protein [Streptomyces lunaelactis]